MEDIRGEQSPIGEEQPNLLEFEDEMLPSVIAKAMNPQKKREMQSPAQLQTLERGREKLALSSLNYLKIPEISECFSHFY